MRSKRGLLVNDLAKTAWLFNKLSLREQVLDLAAEMREQNVVESVNAERIPGTVHREDSGNIGVGVPACHHLKPRSRRYST